MNKLEPLSFLLLLAPAHLALEGQKKLTRAALLPFFLNKSDKLDWPPLRFFKKEELA